MDTTGTNWTPYRCLAAPNPSELGNVQWEPAAHAQEVSHEIGDNTHKLPQCVLPYRALRV